MNSGSAPEPRSMWPVELLHPDGEAHSRLRLGTRWLASFGPAASALPSGPIDVAVVAPSAAERRDTAFLEKAADLLAGGLADDGLAYVIAPRRWSARLLDRLQGSNLRRDLTFAHLPSGGLDQYLVPVSGRRLRYTVSELMSRRPVLRFVVGRLLPARMLEFLGRALPGTGMVIRRAGARPALEWIGSSGIGAADVVIRSRWGKKGGTAILQCFTDRGPSPSGVGKIALSGPPGSRVEAEASALERLGDQALRAGARVPVCTVVRTRTGRPLLLASRLEGRPAAHLLRRGAIGSIEVITQLAAWLESWNRATSVRQAMDPDWLHHRLLEPAATLAPLLHSGSSYLEWLRATGTRALGSALPAVAAHNDLTMVNVLLHDGLPPAIVDWEMADARGLPLADFCYAAVDAVALVRPGSSREAAFARCFLEGTREARNLRRMGERIREASNLAADLVPLCFHACWLHHAANEIRKTSVDHPRPFLRILQSLAERPNAPAVCAIEGAD